MRIWVMPFDEHAARQLAAQQHGPVHTSQLTALGLSPRAQVGRAASGQLLRAAQGVYSFGPITAREGWIMVGVLASGPGAFASHETASLLWGIDRNAIWHDDAARRRVHITTASRRTPAEFVDAHRTVWMDPLAVRHKGPIPLSGIERTIVDLGAMRSDVQIANVIHEAMSSHAVDFATIREELRRRQGLSFRHSVEAAVVMIEDAQWGTFSELEDRFVDLIRRSGIRMPRLNVRFAGDGVKPFRVDALWGAERLVVELDGGRVHGRPRNQRRDQERDAALRAAGHRVLRFGWHDVTCRGGAVVHRIRAILG